MDFLPYGMKTDIQDEATEAQDALSFILLNIRLVQTPIHGVSGGMYVQKWGNFQEHCFKNFYYSEQVQKQRGKLSWA